MSNLENFARSELERAGYFDKDAVYDGMLGEAVMKMVKLFAEEGHSGMSAAIAVNVFKRLARFEPLTPLTGAEDEWNEVDTGLYQNKRCPHVFKQNGQAYDSIGKVFREPSGACFTSKKSHVPIKFPYTPQTQYIDVAEASG